MEERKKVIYLINQGLNLIDLLNSHHLETNI